MSKNHTATREKKLSAEWSICSSVLQDRFKLTRMHCLQPSTILLLLRHGIIEATRILNVFSAVVDVE